MTGYRVPPPHTRGSTVVEATGHYHNVASPAYAGIDPVSVIPRKVKASLPRIRGDRPRL